MTHKMREPANVSTPIIYTVGNYSKIGYIYEVHEDYVELMPTWGYAASAFVLFLIGFFGFFLNLMVIILMFKDKQLWTPLNLILFNLVCSDFSVSILGNPFTLISALSHHWVFGRTMCVVYGFFMTFLGITSITTLTVLSFERYMMISRPLSVRHLSMRGASVSIVFIWCYSFVVSSPPLFGWGNFVNEAANISCSINWEEQTFNTLTYILFLFTTGLIFPVAIITFSYLNIIKTLKKNAMRVGRVSKAESRVTQMVLIMIITFLIAWTPYSIFALIEQFAPYDMVSPGLAVVPALVAKSSICYDPIIYVGMNSQFRASVKKIFGFGNKEDSVQERGLENTLMSPTKPISQAHDNNIKLQYLNPKNNALVSVTIYQENDEVSDTGKSDIVDDIKKKNRLDNVKKKITLSNSCNEDSSEMSTDSTGKDHNISGTNSIQQKYQNKPTPYFKRNKRTVTYNLESTPDLKANPFTISKDRKSNELKNDVQRLEKTSENSSSGNQNEAYNSDDMLLNDECYKKIKSVVEIDKKCFHKWDDRYAVGRLKRDDLQSLPVCDCSSPISLRRKSAVNLSFDTDFPRLKNISSRRSSGGVLSGHTRKLSTAFHGTRGTIVSRLMVDEREKSKLMGFEEMKNAYHGPHSSDEHML